MSMGMLMHAVAIQESKRFPAQFEKQFLASNPIGNPPRLFSLKALALHSATGPGPLQAWMSQCSGRVERTALSN